MLSEIVLVAMFVAIPTFTWPKTHAERGKWTLGSAFMLAAVLFVGWPRQVVTYRDTPGMIEGLFADAGILLVGDVLAIIGIVTLIRSSRRDGAADRAAAADRAPR
jgi:hypothetical protein